MNRYRVALAGILLMLGAEWPCPRPSYAEGTGKARVSAVPSPRQLCERLSQLSGGAAVTPADKSDALKHCIALETSEQKLGRDHWRCYSSCLTNSHTEEAALACDTSCPLPELKLDCDATLLAADVGESFSGSATASKQEVRASFCGRSFAINGDEVVVSAGVHRTMRGLYLYIEEPPAPGTEVETAAGLGDRAIRFGTILPGGGHECGVKFAQRRIGVNITVRPKLPGCPFALLERLAMRIAKRLP